MFRCILIAADGSSEGENATRTGMELAAKLKAEVILLGVIETPNIQGEGEGLPMADPARERALLESFFERFMKLADALEVAVTMEIAQGKSAEQIQIRAERDKADLIVVGRRHLSRFHRWLGGSTSEAVFRDAPCSVMVVR